MEPAYIQAELKKRGITQGDLARELGVTQGMISVVINKHVVSTRIMRTVAAKIGKHPHEVFEFFLRPPKRKIKAA